MLALYRTLSLRYLRQRWTRAILIVASIALGVATLVATGTLSDTMNKAVRASANPLAGDADLMVSNRDGYLDGKVADVLSRIKGVRTVRPLILKKVTILPRNGGKGRTVLLAGAEVLNSLGENPWGIKLQLWDYWQAIQDFRAGKPQCMVGEVLNQYLDEVLPERTTPLRVQAEGRKKPYRLVRVGTVTAEGQAAALSGSMIYTDLATAREVLGVAPGTVSRLDLALEPGYDPTRVRRQVEARLEKLGIRAEIKTPEEQIQATQKIMAGMQAGFTLSGLGALIVGMFLVYNALSVSVAERRHEIGILRSLGATRLQIRRLFAGEAALLGLAGAVLGIPAGLGLAYLGLEPMKEVVRDVFRTIDTDSVDWTVGTVLIAAGAGMITALLASLVPAFRASAEEPAVAVRRVPQNPTWAYRFVQLVVSLCLIAGGMLMILSRRMLPERLGTYGGLMVVLVGALLATPLLAAVAARLVQPLARRLLGIEGRLAADNLVRAPARTGLVIAAVAAGVTLVTQTAGTIRSNREGVLDWAERYITADLFVTAGSPVCAGGQDQLMEENVGREIRSLAPRDIQGVLPIRLHHPNYRDTRVLLTVFDVRQFWTLNRGRTPELPDLDLYRRLSEQPGSVLVSENFAALYGAAPGTTIDLSGVRFKVLGKVVDYWWDHGKIIMDHKDYLARFPARTAAGVDVFEVYLRPGALARQVQTTIARHADTSKGLQVMTHQEVQDYIVGALERIYAIAYGQQIVVGIVAALGVVTALLIAVLQRRLEMGVLRAIGATRGQVIGSVLAEAALMGLIGTAIGLVVGVPFEWYILQVIILEESGYLFPVLIPWPEAGLIAAVALATATLAGLGPAIHAVRIRIPEAIAHE
jgi:putative ABC transport system permease protein